jgi:Glycine cleavage system P-protein
MSTEPFKFAGNDYLGLATHPAVVEALCRAAERYGVSSTSSRRAQGWTDIHEELERGLTALDVVSASHYDGATATAEAALMACRATRRERVLVSRGVHPHYRATMRTYFGGASLAEDEIPLASDGAAAGTTDLAVLERMLTDADDPVAGVVVANPSFLGLLEPMAEAARPSIALTLNMARQELALTAEVVGTLRAVDAMRDDEQHYLGGVSEAILYVHVRASVTIFDDVLNAVFTERLADLLPTRVLPISTEPPEDLDLLIDSQYRQIAELLQPGRRQRSEARMAIRTLLALEGHVAEQVGVSERDVTRVERDVRAGHARDQVFPRLRGLGTEVQGTGLSVKVRFTRNQDAPPVRFVEANETLQAGAIREVDLQNTYKHGAQALADKLRIGTGRAKALRWHLGIDGDPACRHDFVFDRTTRRRYSDIALEKMRESIDGGVDLDAIRAQYLTATRH